MQLLTKELQREIPPLYSQEHVPDPVCVAKFFIGGGAFTWYVIEGSTRERDGCGFGVNCQHRPLSEDAGEVTVDTPEGASTSAALSA